MSEEEFTLHARLAADTRFIADLALCRVMLMNDSRFPWVVLVPRIPDLRELHRLSEADQAALIGEIAFVSARMEAFTGAEKMNVAALGNMVPQLHIHVIARFQADDAWPGPVWCVGDAIPFEPEALDAQTARVRDALSPD